jgi:hypothetical protein
MKELPKEDAKPDDEEATPFIQFRGRQSRVLAEDYNILFTTEERNGVRGHQPLPVVDPEDEDPPANAVVKPLAEELVDTNPLICWGIACEHIEDGEVCGELFATRKELNGHQSVHREDDEEGADNDTGT